MSQNKTLTPRQRFWAKVHKTPECWIWTAGANRTGYGRFYYQGKLHVASRASWMMHYGEIPDRMYVCHRCDTPGCVRPDHLFLGTHEQNQSDSRLKGRRQGPALAAVRALFDKSARWRLRDIKSALPDNEADINTTTIRWALRHLVRYGEVKHIDRGLYEFNSKLIRHDSQSADGRAPKR